MKRQEQQRIATTTRRPPLQPTLDLSSLGDDLPGPSRAPRTFKSKPSSAPQQGKGGVRSSSTQSVFKEIGKETTLSSNASMPSEVKRITRIVTANIGKLKPDSTLSRKSRTQSHRAINNSANEEVVQNTATNLPFDSLCLCFSKLESVYDLINISKVCCHWREAVRSDVLWKHLYKKWWQPDSIKGLSSSFQCTPLPPGCETWKQAFVAKYPAGKQKIMLEERNLAVEQGWLRNRRMPDRHGKFAKDCTPGGTMRKLVHHLNLTFQMCVGRNKPIRLKGKAVVVYFPTSCLLKCPTKFISGGLNLASLKSVKILATSDKLLHTITLATFNGKDWEMVPRSGANSGPLHLIQQHSTSSASLIAGICCESIGGVQTFSSSTYDREPLILLMSSIQLSDLIWKLMELGEFSSQMEHRIVHNNPDPTYGLHGWHVSIQLHTFEKLLWSRDFPQVQWNLQESVSGEKAVFLLIFTPEITSGLLSLSWRAEAFSGELKGSIMLDFTLWDENSEIAWQCTRVICSKPVTLATVEFGPPGINGEKVHAGVNDEKQGVSISMNFCIPSIDLLNRSNDEKPVAAITDLRFALTSDFLKSWFGRSNI